MERSRAFGRLRSVSRPSTVDPGRVIYGNPLTMVRLGNRSLRTSRLPLFRSSRYLIKIRTWSGSAPVSRTWRVVLLPGRVSLNLPTRGAHGRTWDSTILTTSAASSSILRMMMSYMLLLSVINTPTTSSAAFSKLPTVARRGRRSSLFPRRLEWWKLPSTRSIIRRCTPLLGSAIGRPGIMSSLVLAAEFTSPLTRARRGNF